MAESKGATSVEVYGFVGWITSAVAYVLFLFWAYTPNEYLHSIGITYYPDKYWAVALPSYVLLCLCFVVAFYESYNMMTIPPLSSLHRLKDKWSKVDGTISPNDWHRATSHKIPPLMHIPPEVASQILYSRTPQQADSATATHPTRSRP